MKSTYSLFCTILIAFSWSTQNAHAIVNTLLKNPYQKNPGFHLQVDSALGWRTGNVDYLSLTGGIKTSYQWQNAHALVLDFNTTYDRVNQQRFISNRFLHLRSILKLCGPARFELFAQYEFDQELNLQTRLLWGLGPAVVWSPIDDIFLVVGTSYLFEYEHALSEQRAIYHRWNNFILFTFHINDKVQTKISAYIQPRWDKFSDVRILTQLAMLVQLSTHITWKTGFILSYDSDPFAEVKPTDTSLKSGISLNF